MLSPEFTGQFKRDYKLAVRRGLDPRRLETVVSLLCLGEPLPAAYRGHALTDSAFYKGMRKCRIQPDWLPVCKIVRSELILRLIRAGSHSDLF